MLRSYYAARANLYTLWQLHPQWTHAEFAAAVGHSIGWVKKWLKRLREELALGTPLQQVVQGHSHARKQPPEKTQPFVLEQILRIRDQPPEGLRRTPGPEAIESYLQPDSVFALFHIPVPSRRTIARILHANGRISERGPSPHPPHVGVANRLQRALQWCAVSARQTAA